MRNSDKMGYLKIFGGSALLTIIAAAAGWLISIQPVFDDKMCLVGEPPAGQIAIVTDMSEVEDGQVVPAMVREWRDVLPMHHRLSVYRIGDIKNPRPDDNPESDLWPLVSVFEACNPGRADQVNVFVRGSKPAQKKYEMLFAEPLDQAMQKVAAHAGSSSSPILASLGHVTMIPGFKSAQSRTLIIRSDFLELTPRYSHYRKLGTVTEALAASGASIPKLNQVEVRAFYVNRSKYSRYQGADHRDFWEAYFADAQVPGSLHGIAEMGFAELVDYARSRPHPKDLLSRMPDDLLSAIGLVGDPQQIEDRLQQYRDAGADEICLVPATADDPGARQTLESMSRLI